MNNLVLREFISLELDEGKTWPALALSTALGAGLGSLYNVDKPNAEAPIAQGIKKHDNKFSEKKLYSRKQLYALVKHAADITGVPAKLIDGVIHTESGYKLRAKSNKSAHGLMQITPITAKELGLEDAYDPKSSIVAGAKYLKKLLSMFDGDVDLALAAYNAGPKTVKKYGGVPPFKETEGYIHKVRKRMSNSPFKGRVM